MSGLPGASSSTEKIISLAQRRGQNLKNVPKNSQEFLLPQTVLNSSSEGVNIPIKNCDHSTDKCPEIDVIVTDCLNDECLVPVTMEQKCDNTHQEIMSMFCQSLEVSNYDVNNLENNEHRTGSFLRLLKKYGDLQKLLNLVPKRFHAFFKGLSYEETSTADDNN